LKMKSQIFFLRSLVLWATRLVPSVCCEEGMRIVQGLNMLLNRPLNVPFRKPH
jgi:hypothetical protein